MVGIEGFETVKGLMEKTILELFYPSVIHLFLRKLREVFQILLLEKSVQNQQFGADKQRLSGEGRVALIGTIILTCRS